MEKIKLNSNKLNDDIYTVYKARAILFNSYGEILVANYNGIYMLPGGKLDEGENFDCCILREVKEETGNELYFYDIYPFLEIASYQKDFPDRRVGITDRKVVTRYYESGVFVDGFYDQELSLSEIENNFSLDFYSLDELKDLLLTNDTSNPRNSYFTEELLEVLKYVSVPKNIINKSKVRCR